MGFSVVTPTNLGADFDMGAQVAGKINVVAATTAVAGKLRLAAASDITAGTAGAAVDAAQLKLTLANMLGNYQGTWNAATNTPQLLSGAGTKGYLYKVSTAGVSNATTSASAPASGVTAITVASATGITVGQLVVGAGIAATTTVAAISGTTVTLSQATTAALTNGQALTFSTYLDGLGPFYAGNLIEFDGTTWDMLGGQTDTSVNVTDAFGTHLYYAAP